MAAAAIAAPRASSLWQKLRGDRGFAQQPRLRGRHLMHKSRDPNTHDAAFADATPSKPSRYAIRSFLLTDSVAYAPLPVSWARPPGAKRQRSGTWRGTRTLAKAIHRLSTAAPGFAPLPRCRPWAPVGRVTGPADPLDVHEFHLLKCRNWEQNKVLLTFVPVRLVVGAWAMCLARLKIVGSGVRAYGHEAYAQDVGHGL